MCQMFLYVLKTLMTLLFIIIIIYVMTMHTLEESMIISKLKFMGGRECVQSHLPLWYPDMIKFMKNVKPIKCDEETDWVVVVGSIAHITSQAKKKYGRIICRFTDIFLGSGSTTFDGSTTKTSSSYLLRKSDSVRVNCTARNGKAWQGILVGIRKDADVVHRAGYFDYPYPHRGLRLDVLVWCVHSMSRNMFGRVLPLTRHYLQNTLGAIEMESFNVVGQESFDSLFAALTGKRKEELPGFKRMSLNSSHVVIYPYVWSNFRAQGYVTALAQDHSSQQLLTQARDGCYTPSVDHSMNNFFLATRSKYTRHKKCCMGSLPRHKVMMNYALNFFQVYEAKPKVLFGYHGELSHDPHYRMGAADGDMLEWLIALKNGGHLNNTLLIVMSDHGTRSTHFNDTLMARLEERTPYLSISVPTWVIDMYPNIAKNLYSNSKHLTTPFDIHATLMNVLKFEGTAEGDNWDKGISLFKKVPPARICHDATISNQWCTCLAKQIARLSGTVMKHVVQQIDSTINRHTEARRDVCEIVSVGEVIAAVRLQHHTALLTSPSHVPPREEIYQLKFYLEPGHIIFDAQVHYNIQFEKYNVELSNILRKIHLDSNCTKKIERDLHPYCVCK